jgi:hypothetical protein
MLNYLKKNGWHLKIYLKTKTTINEKSVVGFLSFAVMVIFAVADLATGYLGKDLVINEFIYDSFLYITLGALELLKPERYSVIEESNLKLM